MLQFLRVMDLRRVHRRRSASVIDDFTAVARAFARCEVDNDAHRLFVGAFELQARGTMCWTMTTPTRSIQRHWRRKPCHQLAPTQQRLAANVLRAVTLADHPSAV